MTQHKGKLIGGPLDGQIRSLPVDTMLINDPEEKGNPQILIRMARFSDKLVQEVMYLRRHKPGEDGVWEYLFVPPRPVEEEQSVNQ